MCGRWPVDSRRFPETGDFVEYEICDQSIHRHPSNRAHNLSTAEMRARLHAGKARPGSSRWKICLPKRFTGVAMESRLVADFVLDEFTRLRDLLESTGHLPHMGPQVLLLELKELSSK